MQALACCQGLPDCPGCRSILAPDAGNTDMHAQGELMARVSAMLKAMAIHSRVGSGNAGLSVQAVYDGLFGYLATSQLPIAAELIQGMPLLLPSCCCDCTACEKLMRGTGLFTYKVNA